MNNTKAYAAPSPKEALAPFSFQRREVQPKDVQIDIHSVGSAIRISIRLATSGVAQFIQWCQDTKLLGA
jgi:hypothetical protein